MAEERSNFTGGVAIGGPALEAAEGARAERGLFVFRTTDAERTSALKAYINEYLIQVIQ